MKNYKTIRPFVPIVEFTLFMNDVPVQLLHAPADKSPYELRCDILMNNKTIAYQMQRREGQFDIDVEKGNWMHEAINR